MNSIPWRKQRKQVSVTLRALACEMKISHVYLLDLERGRRPRSPALEQRHSDALAAIAKKNPTLGKS